MPIGVEFRVNQYTPYTQGQPSIAMDRDGNFVVAFSNLGDIWARLFWADGTPRTNEFQVNEGLTYGDQDRPIASMARDGRFVVLWQDWDGNDGSIMGVAARIYGADGTPRTTPFIVNNYWLDSQFDGSVAIADDGSFVATWTDAGRDGIAGIFARRFDANAVALGDDFLVNDPSDRSQVTSEIGMDASGAFVIGWTDAAFKWGEPRNVVARVFESDGTPRTGEIGLPADGAGFQRWPVIAVSGFGQWAATWQDESALDGSGMGVWARVFAANGVALTGTIAVNQVVTGDQNNPAITSDWQGNFMVVWDDLSSGSLEVKGRRFDATGAALSDELLLNTTTGGDQFLSSIAVDERGEQFVAGWLGQGDVWAQRFEAFPITAKRFVDHGRSHLDISLNCPGNPGSYYILAAAGSSGTGITLPDGRTWPLAADWIFALSFAAPSGSVFHGFQGTLDADSHAFAQISLPRHLGELGFEVSLAAITLEPVSFAVRTVTRAIQTPLIW